MASEKMIQHQRVFGSVFILFFLISQSISDVRAIVIRELPFHGISKRPVSISFVGDMRIVNRKRVIVVRVHISLRLTRVASAARGVGGFSFVFISIYMQDACQV
jgi:hypothetical protein